MDKVRPIYWQLLAIAVAIYVVGTSLILSDLYMKVGALEFTVDHLAGKCPVKHQ